MIESLESAPAVLCSRPYGDDLELCASASDDARPLVLSSSPGRPSQDDCSCYTASCTVDAAPCRPGTLWQLPRDLYRAPLAAGQELVFNLDGPTGVVVVLNRPASRILDAYARPQPLSSTISRRLAARGILSPTSGRRVRSHSDQPRTLTGWLHITDACNLRCEYCYLHHSNRRMNAETGLTALETVFRAADRGGYRAVNLKYTGGEPMLYVSMVRALHERAAALAAGSGLDLHAVVLSNGTLLTDEMIDWFLGEGVQLTVSLDGVGAAHDVQRPFADGWGSFAHVACSVDRALTRGLTPYLSITVTPDNAPDLSDTVRFALDRGLPFNLNFVRRSSRSIYGLRADQARLLAGLEAAFGVIEESLPPYRLIDGLLDRSAFDVRHRYPCGAGRNYLVIGPRGRVSRCQMSMDQPVTDIWADDPLRAVRNEGSGFEKVPVEEKEPCGECPWRYWCAGGCPLLAYRAAGRSDVPSPYCDVYRALYPQLLRLEGLRLLQR